MGSGKRMTGLILPSAWYPGLRMTMVDWTDPVGKKILRAARTAAMEGNYYLVQTRRSTKQR